MHVTFQLSSWKWCILDMVSDSSFVPQQIFEDMVADNIMLTLGTNKVLLVCVSHSWTSINRDSIRLTEIISIQKDLIIMCAS